MEFNQQPRNKPQILITIMFTVAAVLLAACGAAPSAQSSAPKAKINYQMGWVHEYSAAGLYAAQQNGHFAAQNLEVSLIEGGFGDQGYVDPITQVLAGAADIGETSATSLLVARAEGKPVVAVAATLQRSPFTLISLAKNNIFRPSDLPGKRVAVSNGGAVAIYQALLTSQGIDPAEVTIVPRTSYGIDPLVNGEVDVLGGWITNEGIELQEAGYEPQFILPSDYGVNAYETLIFTTEGMIAEHPDVVERFLGAVIQGYQDVVDQPQRAAELVLTYDPSLVQEEQERRIQALLPLIKPAGSSIGAMQAETWEQTYQIMLDGGVLSAPLDVETAYTLTFLDKVSASVAANQ